MWDPYGEFQSEVLPNGLTVHAAYWPERPWEMMGFLIHSGAEYDPVGLEALSHFVEHLVSGNGNVPPKEMEAFFEDRGGWVNLGLTGYPYTYYLFFLPADREILAKAFSMFGHMLLSAKLEKFIERERQIVISEFYRQFPMKFKLDLEIRKHKALYSGCWLERSVRTFGNPESVSRIGKRDLQSYYDKHYTPANMSVVGVGAMRLTELVELLSESPFATRKEGKRTQLPVPVADIALPLENRYVLEASKYVNPPIQVGAYQSSAKIPGNINGCVIRIMRKMLDEVLNEEVRERRAWAYAVGSSQHDFRHFYKFSIDCAALALKAIDNIEEVMEACVASMSDREDLFEHVKRRALANSFMIDSTGKGICEGSLEDLADRQRIISLKEIKEDLERVTMSDIVNALQWLRPERRWTVITKP